VVCILDYWCYLPNSGVTERGRGVGSADVPPGAAGKGAQNRLTKNIL